MSGNGPPIKSATDARQGETPGIVRWVLLVSLAAAIVAIAAAFLIARSQI